MRRFRLGILLVLGMLLLLSVGFWGSLWLSILFGSLGLVLVVLYFRVFRLDDRGIDDRIRVRRNWVRILVTYVATSFIFLGGFGLIGLSLYSGLELEGVKEFYLSILPVASSIVAYWFGSRGV